MAYMKDAAGRRLDNFTSAQVKLPCASRAVPPHNPITPLSNGTDTEVTYQRWHIMQATAWDLEIEWPNYYNNNGQEANGPNDITVRASIVLTTGEIIPVFFGGKRGVVIEPGGTAKCDPIPVKLNKGTDAAGFWVHTHVKVASVGQKWPLGYVELNGYQDRQIVGSDATLSATTAFTNNTGANSYGASAIRGKTTPSPSPIVAIIGDSISAGYMDNSLQYGWFARAINHRYRFQSLAMSSQKLDDWITPARYWRRAAAISEATHVVVALGTNNLGAGLATNQPNFQKVYDLLAAQGKKVYAVTLPPYTTSTDSFLTVANQTVTANEANRLAMNAWIRSTPAPLSGYIDLADALETARDSGKWKADGTAGGKHTTDGVHPNDIGAATGAAGTVAAINSILGPVSL